MTSLSSLRAGGLQLLRSVQGQPSLLPAISQLRLTHTSNVDQGQKSSIPARAESHGYSPFKVDFKENKVEWALARVDDLVNWGRKVRAGISPGFIINPYPRVHCGLSPSGWRAAPWR